jgi:hypothetical protein
MNWVKTRQFQLVKLSNRHYVFRRNNSGNTEINVPKTIQTKFQARDWLLSHPNAPKKFKPKKKPSGNLKPWEETSPGGRKYVKIQIGGKLQFRPAPGKEPNFMVNAMRLKGENVKWNFTCDLKKQLKVFTTIGKGRQGIIFKASRYSDGRYPFAIKVSPKDIRAEKQGEKPPAQVEFDIQKACEQESAGVVKVHQLIKCPKFITPSQMDMPNVQNASVYDKGEQTIILMEYCSEGSLTSWLKKNPNASDKDIQRIIKSVLTTLYSIRQTYPDFNHNDLHLENVFVSGRGVLIGDFGWARLKRMGTNPAVNTANGTRTASFWGVGPETSNKYDHHLFLNELREWVMSHSPSRFPASKVFLDMAVPSGYRGETDTHVIQWRLKYKDTYSDLPSLIKLVSSPYVAGKKRITSANLVRAKGRLRKLGGAAKLPSIPLNKRTYTNQQLVNMSAANFLKLSPVTRARAKNLRTGAKVKINKGKAPEKLKVNLTARVKKVASPPKSATKHKPFPRDVLKTQKFNKFVNKIWKEQNKKANETYNNAWSRARTKAMNIIQNRVNRSLQPFSPSPINPRNSPRRQANNYKISPSSGRLKIKAPNSGRMVYADGSTISLSYLKNLATRRGKNIKGLRSKENIARKIFLS